MEGLSTSDGQFLLFKVSGVKFVESYRFHRRVTWRRIVTNAKEYSNHGSGTEPS